MATRTVTVSYNPDKYNSFEPSAGINGNFSEATVLYRYPGHPDEIFDAHREHSFCLYYDPIDGSQGSISLQVPNNFEGQTYQLTSTDQVAKLVTPFFNKEKEDDEEKVTLETLEIGIDMAFERENRHFTISGYSTNTYDKTACCGVLVALGISIPRSEYHDVGKSQ